MGLPQVSAILLAGGPNNVHTLYHPDGSESRIGPAERAQQLAERMGVVDRFAADGPF
ncbi:hypothetical protein L3Q65_18340 [Amycolatopsis sp. FU40]|uniref:hypothetical protein n=1 Tax=Amycolatopsis sp. FU40 TaxID=2914159 RepID=UPI001F399706|nr:hypothetical protein [Amycolatopsis sp. FU40]UKD58597.1 hypothetical protein L3Q65_18340 [Amycolatopsis sp. FU40]